MLCPSRKHQAFRGFSRRSVGGKEATVIVQVLAALLKIIVRGA